MSNLIVITFPNVDDAGKALSSLQSLQRENMGSIDDWAVIVKEADGKINVKETSSKGAKTGAVGGGLIGLLLTSVFFPIAGIVIGAVAGALIGHSMTDHVDKKFVEEVKNALAPNSSALFVLGKGSPDAVAAAMRPFEGTLYHTNLDPDREQQLRDALK